MFSVLFVTPPHPKSKKDQRSLSLHFSLYLSSSLHSFLSQGVTCSNLPTSPSPRRIIFTPRRRTRWLNSSSAWNRAQSEKGRWPTIFVLKVWRGAGSNEPFLLLSRKFYFSVVQDSLRTLFALCTTWLSHYQPLLLLLLKILNMILILIFLFPPQLSVYFLHSSWPSYKAIHI